MVKNNSASNSNRHKRNAWIMILQLGAALFAVAQSSSARADDDTEQARAAFLRAQEHYAAARYAQAAIELDRAYALKPMPVLLRYLGDAHVQLQKFEIAKGYYREFIKRTASPAQRRAVEEIIAELDETRQADADGRSRRWPRGAKIPVQLMPTGTDSENPFAKGNPAPGDAGITKPASRNRAVTAAKWTALAIGATGIILGIVFDRLSASKADDLRQAVVRDCPAQAPSCGGNPQLDRPQVTFGQEHYDLETSYLRLKNRSTVSFVVGGSMLGAACSLFIWDAWRARRDTREATPPGVRFGMAGDPHVFSLVGNWSF